MSIFSVTRILILLAWAVCASAVAADNQSRYRAPYPVAASKKGLQVELVEDALTLGVKHAALNVNLSQVIAPTATSGEGVVTWTTGDEQYFFHRAYVEQLDQAIRPLSDSGALVHLIILAYQPGDAHVRRILLHPNYDDRAPNRLGAFNSRTPDGRAWLQATMEFLSERWSRPDRKYGRVAGFIVGNEVNSHWWWSNQGRVTMQEFADDYLQTLRIVHRAVRRQSSWARVYISLDHHWNSRYPVADELQAYAGRELIDYLAARSGDSQHGDFDWHVAYHPYPENLFEPRFWNDRSVTDDAQTPRITFKNLAVLTRYLRRPAVLCNGQPRRVILSEQGFHSPDGLDGERLQAAAYCYAYRKVAGLSGVDAFILHRHVDHPGEGGLRLGLRRRVPGANDPRPKKLIYECFRLADTPDWEDAFRFALPIVGLEDWPPVPPDSDP